MSAEKITETSELSKNKKNGKNKGNFKLISLLGSKIRKKANLVEKANRSMNAKKSITGKEKEYTANSKPIIGKKRANK